MSVAIVSDTCHYLPAELTAAECIHQVSLYVRWPEGDQRESEITDYDAYYQRLSGAAQRAGSSLGGGGRRAGGVHQGPGLVVMVTGVGTFW